MRKENIGLMAFGIILLLIGLVATFYHEYRWLYIEPVYPYQTIGVILVVAGIVSTLIGLAFKP